MATNTAIKEINVTTGGVLDYQPTITDGFSVYKILGNGTLTSNVTITITGSNNAPKKVTFLYAATFALGGNNIVIMGKTLTAQQASAGNTIIQCNKTQGGSFFATVLDSSTISPKNVAGVKTTILSGAGDTVTLQPNVDYQTQVLQGIGVLAGSYVYQANFTQNGEKFRVIYNGSFAATGSSIEIFGVSLTDTQMLNGQITFDAEYDGSATKISMSQSPNKQLIGLPELLLKEISFEDNECGNNSIIMIYPLSLDGIQFVITKQPADTYDVAIVVNGSTTLQTLHFSPTDLLNQEVFTSFSPYIFAVGDILWMDVTSTGGGGGGRLNAQISITRT